MRHYDADIHSSVVSVYAQDEIQLVRDLSLTLGLRYDDFSTTGSAVVPRAGIVYSYSKEGNGQDSLRRRRSARPAPTRFSTRAALTGAVPVSRMSASGHSS